MGKSNLVIHCMKLATKLCKFHFCLYTFIFLWIFLDYGDIYEKSHFEI